MKDFDFKAAGKSVLVSAFVVPAMVLGAFWMSRGTFEISDAKLSGHFQAAYKWNPKARTYTSYEFHPHDMYHYCEDENGHRTFITNYGEPIPGAHIEQGDFIDKISVQDNYPAHPLITYPMYVAVTGLAYAAMRRRRDKNSSQINNQKTR